MKSTKYTIIQRARPSQFKDEPIENILKHIPDRFINILKEILAERKLRTDIPNNRLVEGVAYRGDTVMFIACTLYTDLGNNTGYTQIQRDAIAALRAYHLKPWSNPSDPGCQVRTYIIDFGD